MDATLSCGDSHRVVGFGHRLGVDVRYDVLAEYGAAIPEYVHIDLLLVAGTVALADRYFRRTTGRTGWSRRIEIRMPVREPDRWNFAKAALEECLQFVTGDRWTFEFIEGANGPHQRTTGLHRETDVVVPFSGGLDSFLLRSDLESSGVRTLPVTAWTTAAVGRASRRALDTSRECARVPIHLAPGGHAEPTFRTRTFLFGCVASVASVIAGTHRVFIAENGQGAIGAALVPFGAEAPYRNTHPLFTQRMAHFLAQLGINVSVVHPYVWRTKGSVLKELVERGATSGWERTVSCSRDLKRHKHVRDERACGICGNCLLRRVSVHAAGVLDTTQYHWNVTAPRLSDAVAPGGNSGTTETDRAIAIRSVGVMDAFATMATDDPALRRNAFEMSQRSDQTRSEIEALQVGLHSAHAAEWRNFLRDLPSNSWVMSYLGEPNVST